MGQPAGSKKLNNTSVRYTGGIGEIVNKQRIVCDRIAESTCIIQIELHYKNIIFAIFHTILLFGPSQILYLN